MRNSQPASSLRIWLDQDVKCSPGPCQLLPWSDCRGLPLMGLVEQTEPVVRTGREGVEAAALRGGAALLALTDPQTEMISGRRKP